MNLGYQGSLLYMKLHGDDERQVVTIKLMIPIKKFNETIYSCLSIK